MQIWYIHLCIYWWKNCEHCSTSRQVINTSRNANKNRFYRHFHLMFWLVPKTTSFLRVGPHLPPWSSFAVHMPWWLTAAGTCPSPAVGTGRLAQIFGKNRDPNLFATVTDATWLRAPQEADLDLDFTCFHLRLCLELLWQEHDEA